MTEDERQKLFGFETESCANKRAYLLHCGNGVVRVLFGERESWISRMNGKLIEQQQCIGQHIEHAIHLNTLTSQFTQVVCFAERNAMPDQKCFEVFLSTLLRVKADTCTP